MTPIPSKKMPKLPFLLALICVPLFAGAQGTFNLPWNPDENGDMTIGVADLQAFLSVYNSEFTNVSVSGDGSIAFHLADEELNRTLCEQYCKQLPGPWNIASDVECFQNVDEISTMLPQWNDGEWWLRSSDLSFSESILKTAKWSTYAGQIYIGQSQASHAYLPEKCLCSIQERQRVQYDFCYLEALPENESQFRQCVEEKTSEGWYPLGGVAQDYGRMYQAFWRWEQ